MSGQPTPENISIVTPVYNAKPFLPQLYDSIRHQTYGRWEWVVVDDGSTDGGDRLLRQWADGDPRIRLHRIKNSGSAKLPRDMAVCMAANRLVVCIDADDYVDADYLEKMHRRMTETGADIVYPTMSFFQPDGTVTLTLPSTSFDQTRAYRGRDLVRETVPDWNISGGGGLYDRKIWTNLSYPQHDCATLMNSDEVDERIYLTNAAVVAFAPTTYHYRMHGGSITKAFSVKQFHRLKTDRELLRFIIREFGIDSEEYRRINRQTLYTVRSALALYAANFDRAAAFRDEVFGDMAANFGLVDSKCLSTGERIKFCGLVSFKLIFVLFCLKYAPASIFKAVRAHLLNRRCDASRRQTSH